MAEKGVSDRVLVEKLEGKRPLTRPKRRWKGRKLTKINIKIRW
jgi:hypothetical protein